MEHFAVDEKLLKISSDEALQYIFMQALDDDDTASETSAPQHAECHAAQAEDLQSTADLWLSV